jgi:hypothetical protein
MPALLCIRVRKGRLILEAAAEDLLSTKLFTIEHQAGWWEAAIDHAATNDRSNQSAHSCFSLPEVSIHRTSTIKPAYSFMR